MKKRAVAGIVGAGIVGISALAYYPVMCGGSATLYPSSSLLRPGDQAVIASEKGFRFDYGLKALDPGVRVTVGHDPGSYYSKDTHDENYPGITDTNYLSQLRKISVTVESGPYKGEAFKVGREYLRKL